MKPAQIKSRVGVTVGLITVVAILGTMLVASARSPTAAERAAGPEWVKPRLNDVTVVAPDDVWVVGQQRDPTGLKWPLILHRDDTGWAEVPFARGSWNVDAWLVGVDAVTSGDVWAVGNYRTGGTWYPLALHFDGATWTRVPMPDLHRYVEVTDVVAIDAARAFIVGRVRGDPLVLGWDGSAWTRRPFPMPARDALEAVDASGKRIWVTGGRKFYGAPQAYRFAVGHWTMPPMPPLPDYAPWVTMDAHLYGVEIQRTDRVWAVGSQLLQTDYGGDFLDNRFELVIERWDGHRWSIVPTPRIPGPFESATDVASTRGAVWVAGYVTPGEFGHTRALVLVRTPGGWRIPVLPDWVSRHRSALTAIDGLRRGAVWAVGSVAHQPLILRGAAGSWEREL